MTEEFRYACKLYEVEDYIGCLVFCICKNINPNLVQKYCEKHLTNSES